jgi:branched-chain amino acid transport system ATP-binding protein
MSTLLEVSGLSVRFGGVRALTDVSLTVEAGQRVGLIGPNGAGKTTFIDAVSGFVRVAAGRVTLDGADVTRWPAHARARRGLGRTWQSVELFDDLSVSENLQIGLDHPIGQTGRTRSPEQLCELVGVPGVAGRFPNELSHGQQKMVGVARALATRPRVLCLDEPAAGLDTSESAMLAERLVRIADEGTAILLVDHDMNLVMSVCHTIAVLEFGAVIASGPPADIRTDPAVISAYLGSSARPPGALDATPSGADRA